MENYKHESLSIWNSKQPVFVKEHQLVQSAGSRGSLNFHKVTGIHITSSNIKVSNLRRTLNHSHLFFSVQRLPSWAMIRTNLSAGQKNKVCKFSSIPTKVYLSASYFGTSNKCNCFMACGCSVNKRSFCE